ncbi:MAG TPA: hypothetical protein VJB96_01280 [Patescibacteria group bacterium]|nr:hypothetical protein [Patescibacteria group bacterium]
MTKAPRFSWLAALVIVIALGIVLWPLFHPGFFASDDGEWMVIRLSAFYQSLAGGQFPVRFLGRLNNSYGYPVANFLYPGFLYIGSMLHLAGMSFPIAVKFIFGASVAGGTVALYAALRTRFRTTPSLLGTLSFVFAPYLLYDLYHRGSVGEILAFGAATLVILALTRNLAWVFAPAVGFMIVSHNTTALIVGAAIVFLLAVHPERLRMLLSGLLGIGMSAFFWLPALVEKNFVRFDAVSVSDPSRYFIDFEHAGLLGLGTVLALAMTVRRYKQLTRNDRIFFWLTVAGLSLSLTMSFPLWDIPLLGKLVQFPYRFMALPVLFGSWVVAFAAEQLKGWRFMLFTGLLAGVWLMIAVPYLWNVEHVNREEGFYTTNEGTTTVANEYMPRWVTQIPTRRSVETLEVVSGDAQLSTRTFASENITVEINAKEVSLIQINKIYYPGWGVTIDNQRVPIDYRNSFGVMQVDVPKGTHTLAASFRETPFRFSADLVSLASLCIYVVIFGRRRTHT